MLAKQQLAVLVEGEAIAAGFFAGERFLAGVSARVQKFLEAFALFPAPDFVGRDVGKEQGVFALDPDGAFGPGEFVSFEKFDERVFGDELVESGIEAFDGPERLQSRFGSGCQAVNEMTATKGMRYMGVLQSGAAKRVEEGESLAARERLS